MTEESKTNVRRMNMIVKMINDPNIKDIEKRVKFAIINDSIVKDAIDEAMNSYNQTHTKYVNNSKELLLTLIHKGVRLRNKVNIEKQDWFIRLNPMGRFYARNDTHYEQWRMNDIYLGLKRILKSKDLNEASKFLIKKKRSLVSRINSGNSGKNAFKVLIKLDSINEQLYCIQKFLTLEQKRHKLLKNEELKK